MLLPKKPTPKYMLFFKKYGKGKRTFVLLHGQISTHRYMEQLALELARKGTVYSFDLLGFGKSPRPRKIQYTLEDHVQALRNSISELELNKIELIGHSMGAVIAAAYAHRHPNSVSALYTSAFPLLDQPNPYEQLIAEYPGTRFIVRGLSGHVICKIHAMLPKIAARLIVKNGRRSLPLHPDYVFEDSLEHSWRSFNRSMKNVVIKEAGIELLMKNDLKTVLFFGKNDHITKQYKKKLAKTKHRLVELDAKHDMPITHSKEMAKHF